MRLTVLLTTPRLPAGLLTGPAWRTIFAADAVLVADERSPLALVVGAAGVRVEAVAGRPSAAVLLARAASGDVVWLASDDGDEALTTQLASDVVRRAESGDGTGPEVEVTLGSYDPAGARLLDLVAVMDRLRTECPWDREQTHESLVRYLVEEAYETIEAIETGDYGHLREELGDLLLQVMFHARIAAEDPDEPFDIDVVAGQIVEKLIRRHPHVFADVEVAGAAEVNDNWETIKASEKSRGSAMDGIPPGLPALSLADKVVARALRAGAAVGVTPAELPSTTPSTLDAESFGAVLFALVTAANAAGIDAEQALRERVRLEVAQVRDLEQRALPEEPATGG